MWLRNSARVGRKGDKLSKRWLGPYKVSEVLGKGLHRLANLKTGHVLKKTYNRCRYTGHNLVNIMHVELQHVAGMYFSYPHCHSIHCIQSPSFRLKHCYKRPPPQRAKRISLNDSNIFQFHSPDPQPRLT